MLRQIFGQRDSRIQVVFHSLSANNVTNFVTPVASSFIQMDRTRKTRPVWAGERPAYLILCAILGLVEEFSLQRQKLRAKIVHELITIFERISRKRQETRLVVFVQVPQKIFIQFSSRYDCTAGNFILHLMATAHLPDNPRGLS